MENSTTANDIVHDSRVDSPEVVRETALITGASGGIGYELAKIFAENCYNLVLVARNTQKLEEVARELRDRHDATVKVISKDLSVISSPEEIYRELAIENIDVDVLVNNAGYATSGPFSNTDIKAEMDMLQVNIASLTHLTGLFLKGMLSRSKGKILNVASTAAFQPGPLMAAYYASKSFVLSFSEALSYELRGTGVTVTALCPGITRTGFQTRAQVETNSHFSQGMSAVDVACSGYRGLMEGKRIVVPGFMNKLHSFFIRFIPTGMLLRIISEIHGKH